MLIKKVIVNSSPLIVLFKSQQAELLAQLFDEILVPGAVWDEVTAVRKNDLNNLGAIAQRGGCPSNAVGFGGAMLHPRALRERSCLV